MQKPHWTAPASTNASWTRCSESPSGQALDRDDLVAVRLRRQHQARADERAVEEHRARAAFSLLTGVFRARAGRAAREARTAGSRPARRRPRAASPLTVSAILTPAPASAHARPAREARGAGRRRCRGRRRSGSPPQRPARRTTPPRPSGHATRPATGPARAERRAQLAPLAVGDDRERADGDHHRVPRPDLHERLRRRRTARPGRPRSARPARRRSASARRGTRAAQCVRTPRTDASSTDASSTSSGGSASPAGEAVPRFPPSVPRLRICGEPTVRDASRQRRQRLAHLARHHLRVRQPGAEPQRPVLARPAAQLRAPRSG